MSSQLERRILDLFECPVCSVHMYPPIRQCVRGHTFCSECFDRFQRCPICRGSKGVGCDFILERIYLKLTVPCRYNFNGCKFSAKGLTVKDHEMSCGFSSGSRPRRGNIAKNSKIPRRIQ
ncbi:putative E3 ubiquitin-protein ligase SINAT1 [Anoplophora glabripennis]|uniref:putative E3 ubiquitin-protein ligase SINAT1 n=1 Tax=Anoplophora glabripennis TaxID=217634 RepID=UPI0008735264|nr:putative E3 ubiquitin-protein ligase SINAT1 [Anoplophora glabripennis]